MGQLVNVLLAIDKAHRGPWIVDKLLWIKPGWWTQLSHSLCLEYLLQV